jgi:signal transduction histidine kinase
LAQTLERRVEDRTRELQAATSRLRAEATERERVEVALREAQKMEAVGQLTAGIAHDFNNILMVVLGSLELVVRRLKQDAGEPRRFAELAMSAAERGASLTKQLLAFSRLQPLQPTQLDLNVLVAEMTPVLQRTLGPDVAVETHLEDGVRSIHADPKQIESALFSLAMNAREAMPAGGKLELKTANAELEDVGYGGDGSGGSGFVVLSVADTGAGMTEDVLAKAFDPFFTTKAAGHGSGLGLSQVYGFVRQSGGHMRLASEPGHGTVVRLYLPQSEPVRPAEEPALRSVRSA